jgi:hypothetical protein
LLRSDTLRRSVSNADSRPRSADFSASSPRPLMLASTLSGSEDAGRDSLAGLVRAASAATSASAAAMLSPARST